MASKKFKLKDIFTLADIIKKIGIVEEIKSISSSVTSVLKQIDYNSDEFKDLGEEEKQALIQSKSSELVDQAQDTAIGEILSLLLKNIHDCKEPIVTLIASLNNCTVDEAENLGISELKDLFVEVFKNDNMIEVFQKAGSMLKS